MTLMSFVNAPLYKNDMFDRLDLIAMTWQLKNSKNIDMSWKNGNNNTNTETRDNDLS